MHSLTALSIQHGHRRTGIGLLGDQTKSSVLYHMATLTTRSTPHQAKGRAYLHSPPLQRTVCMHEE